MFIKEDIEKRIENAKNEKCLVNMETEFNMQKSDNNRTEMSKSKSVKETIDSTRQDNCLNTELNEKVDRDNIEKRDNSSKIKVNSDNILIYRTQNIMEIDSHAEDETDSSCGVTDLKLGLKSSASDASFRSVSSQEEHLHVQVGKSDCGSEINNLQTSVNRSGLSEKNSVNSYSDIHSKTIVSLVTDSRSAFRAIRSGDRKSSSSSQTIYVAKHIIPSESKDTFSTHKEASGKLSSVSDDVKQAESLDVCQVSRDDEAVKKQDIPSENFRKSYSTSFIKSHSERPSHSVVSDDDKSKDQRTDSLSPRNTAQDIPKSSSMSFVQSDIEKASDSVANNDDETSRKSLTVDPCDALTLGSCDALTVDSFDALKVDSCDALKVDSCDALKVDSCDALKVDSCDALTVDSCDVLKVDSCNTLTVDSCNTLTVDSCGALKVDSCNALTVNPCDGNEKQTNSLVDHPLVESTESTESSTQDPPLGFTPSQNDNPQAKKVRIETQTSFGFSASNNEQDGELEMAFEGDQNILEFIPELENENSQDAYSVVDSLEESYPPPSFLPNQENSCDRVTSPETVCEISLVDDSEFSSIVDLIQNELRASACSPVHVDLFEIVDPLSPLPVSPIYDRDSPVSAQTGQDVDSCITDSVFKKKAKKKKKKKKLSQSDKKPESNSDIPKREMLKSEVPKREMLKSEVLKREICKQQILKPKSPNPEDLALLTCGMKRTRVAHQPRHDTAVHKLPRFASEAPPDAVTVRPHSALMKSRVGDSRRTLGVRADDEETSIDRSREGLRRLSEADSVSWSKPAGRRLRANSMPMQSESKGVKRKQVDSETSVPSKIQKTEQSSIPIVTPKTEVKKTAFDNQLLKCLNDNNILIDDFITEISQNRPVEDVWKSLVDAIVKHLQNFTVNIHNDVYSTCEAGRAETRQPVLTREENKILSIVKQFLNVHKNAPKSLLMEGLWKAVFVPEKEANKLYGKQALCRVFVALCHAEGDVEQARVFLFYVIMCRHLSFPCICLSAVAVWPLTLIKTRQDANPVVVVMEYIIMKSLEGSSTRTKSKQISECFCKLCDWSNVPRASEDVLRQAVEKLDNAATLNQTEKVFEVMKSIELLLVYEGWAWLYRHFILKHFMSIHDRWNNRAEDGLSPLYVQSVLKIIGEIFRLNVKPEQKDVRKLIDKWLLTFLNRKTAVAAVPLCSAAVMLEISPFLPLKAVRTLLLWSEKHRDIITDEFKHKLSQARQVFSARIPMFTANLPDNLNTM
ncbi:uncharacterized protein LOC121371954 [Gigantopelta aegis]|uniref:uncharacterized protein LOC121371954 n=1 Tax=Gigantopelta aegis TaxID=1735272 RepID=UPI001B88C9F9|nr:uncharacterized protein LOC121371954 [Gigantopelta aegis]